MKASQWCKEAAQIMSAHPEVVRFGSGSSSTSRRLDARETAMFSRQLEQLMSEFFDIITSPTEFRKFFPVRSTTSPGAESVTYRQFERFGQAKKIADYAGDLPHVNIQGVEFTNKIVPFGAAYIISLQDIRNAMFTGLPLDAEMVQTARDAIERAFNELVLRGDTAAGVSGFLNHASINSGAAPTGTWGTATGDQIYEDLLTGLQTVKNQTLRQLNPTTVLLDDADELNLMKARSADSDETVLGFFRRQFPNIEIMFTHELTNEAFFYAKSPRTGWAEVPQEFEQFAPQWENLAYSVPCHGRCGGAIVPYPIAYYRMTGI